MRAANTILSILSVAGLIGGCASSPSAAARLRWLIPAPAADDRDDRDAIARDPLAYLEQVRQRCAQLDGYRVTLVRIERRGFGPFRRLVGPERIEAWFRRTPFSVRLRWLDPDSPHAESVFVAGRNDGKVLYRPRRGWLGGPPGVLEADPGTAVRLGQSLRPITDFGLERLMEQTLDAIRRAGGAAVVTACGPVYIDDIPQPVEALTIRVPPEVSRPPVIELYIDPRRELPVCAVLRSTSGRLEAAYIYRDIDTDVHVRDDDFRLEPPEQHAGDKPDGR